MATLARSNSHVEIMFLRTKIAFNTDNFAALIIHSIDINDPKENELLVLIYLYEVSHQSNLQWIRLLENIGFPSCMVAILK